MSGNSVHLVIRKEVKAENQAAWLKMANELSACTWKEAGCISYSFVRSKANAELFFIVEEWESQAHLDAHCATEHFIRLVPAMDAISFTASLEFCADALTAKRSVEPSATLTGNSVHLVIRKEVKAANQTQWLHMAEELAQNTWNEAGCIRYCFVRSKADAELFFIVEEWESQAHLDAHCAAEHFVRLVPAMDAISNTASLEFCTDTLVSKRPIQPTKKSVHLVIRKGVKAENQAAWLKMADELAECTWKEAGCIRYCFVRSKADAELFFIVEEWESQAHLDAHCVAEHFVRLVPAMDAISNTVSLEFCADALSVRRAVESTVVPSGGSVHLVIKKGVKAANQAAWLKMANELAESTWKEAGCISYTFVRSKSNGEVFFILEEWESQAHLDAHCAIEHFSRLVPLMDGISTTDSLEFCVDTLVPKRAVSPPKIKILVLYDSCSNCTERMANLIAEGVLLVEGTEVRIRSVPGDANHWDRSPNYRLSQHPFATYDDVYWAEGIACGTPTNLGSISWRMKKFWDDFSQAGGWGGTDGKIGTAFTSSGGNSGGGELVNQAMCNILLNFGYTVIGITDYVSFKQTMHYGSVCAKAPRDDLDRMPCIRQGTRLAEFTGLYLHGKKELHPLNASKAKDMARWGFPGIPPKNADMAELVQLNRAPVKLAVAPFVPKKTALVYTRALEYIHGATSAGAVWVNNALTNLGYTPTVSDDPRMLEEIHREWDLIVFLNNSGEIFNPDPSKNILAKHIEAGKGIVGIHAALACFLSGADATGATVMTATTPVFENIFKAGFRNHPPIQTAMVHVDQRVARNIGLSGLVPAQFSHTDEFYNFNGDPCADPDVQVLAYVDEKTYTGGTMGERHALAWVHTIGPAKAPVFCFTLAHDAGCFNGQDANYAYLSAMMEAGIRYCGSK